MATHAWEYGWLMSYPKDAKEVVCYRYEPWHYRYVGREMAKKIHDSGLTIREYLWANFTQVDPACVALAPPPLVTPGEPRSCAFAAASPSPPTDPPTTTPAAAPTPPGTASAGPTDPGSPSDPPAATEPPVGAPTGALGGIDPIVLLALAALVVAVGALALSRRSRARPR
jgi:D-alanyl-D-alanine carboxypeptidase